MEPSIDNARSRTKFYPSYTMVYGWPGTGGFYILQCDGVDLEFVRLDRIVPTPRSENPAGKDIDCINMRKVGAIFYESNRDYHLKTTNLARKTSEEFIEVFGWPTAGGVWALKVATDKPHSFGIRNAFTVDEKCRAMEMMGGVLC
ncbi:hypothetical protein LZ30DRAFT_602640 [Colletotrichum cereale]|nr:hypothetical protein LZ30DRAFT_602640 [Colletotrichum cereale]